MEEKQHFVDSEFLPTIKVNNYIWVINLVRNCCAHGELVSPRGTEVNIVAHISVQEHMCDANQRAYLTQKRVMCLGLYGVDRRVPPVTATPRILEV
jgi:abortive infection bacteriophage resistance protein